MESAKELRRAKTEVLRDIVGAQAYEELRTGLTFRDVRLELAREQRERHAGNDFMFVTRATVLGRWSQRKREMFESLVEPSLRKCPRHKLTELAQRNGGGVLSSLLNGRRNGHETP